MAQTQPEEKVFNIGIIGYGMSARIFHIPFIATTPSLKLHSILQRSSSAPSSTTPSQPGEPQVYTSLDPFLSDPSLDVVVICTPPDTHFSLAKRALEVGVHVMVEKPFVPTSAEADELIALASTLTHRGGGGGGRGGPLLLNVYQNRRWDSDFLTVRSLIENQHQHQENHNTPPPLGHILDFHTHFDRYRPSPSSSSTSKAWKASLPLSRGGSALYDLGTHLVDQVYVLFGMPSSVFAKFVNQREARFVIPPPTSTSEEEEEEEEEEEIPDSLTMQLFYPSSGLTAHISISILSASPPDRQPRFWVRGTRGSYRKTGLDPQEDQLKSDNPKVGDPAFGRETADRYGTLVTVHGDGDGLTMTEDVYPTVEPQTYGKIYELFGEALRGNGSIPVPVPATEARDVLRILEAARESAKTRREVNLV
ncbi:oxidoreductase family protein [Xylariaceae sp. FL0594]|nr:oxidoreductase family protein [Xylariaceae sp. FL0594]